MKNSFKVNNLYDKQINNAKSGFNVKIVNKSSNKDVKNNNVSKKEDKK